MNNVQRKKVRALKGIADVCTDCMHVCMHYSRSEWLVAYAWTGTSPSPSPPRVSLRNGLSYAVGWP